MAKQRQMTAEEKKIQKLLDKLMSEEMCAHLLYEACSTASRQDENSPGAQSNFAKMFVETSADELKDHFAQLREWAAANGYAIPFSFREWQKNDPRGAKQLDSLRRGESTVYYLKEAIKSEKAAIESYQRVVSDIESTAARPDGEEADDVPYEIAATCLRIYFDEIEHLEQFTSMLQAAEAGADLAAY